MGLARAWKQLLLAQKYSSLQRATQGLLSLFFLRGEGVLKQLVHNTQDLKLQHLEPESAPLRTPTLGFRVSGLGFRV